MTLIGQAISLVLVVVGVLLIGTPLASAHDLWWGAAGGVAGGFALIAFYRALSRGVDDGRRADDRGRQCRATRDRRPAARRASER